MIRILSLVVSLALLLGSVSLSFAKVDCNSTCCQKMERLVKKRLGLTDKERAEVFGILRNAKTERRTFVDQLRAPDMTQEKRLGLHAKIKEVDEAARAELASIFSEAQMEKFDEIMIELREKILSCVK
ncbi:hypothetical protein [Halodesulfovibrio sp. MK-HDV]|jgi:hypothetical protein|uniref:hypothetical protein n=1 Tax=unclassified Halodesulfovibrio TaxID=2644657 RepID=UPI001370C584|nr:hypothetical protein [Halodesulfovibrio sp. MK-HDV]KAF1074270.1 hypothetical protein MKHDV_02848 [Halodesulfovibrio sp. MK-HDV]